MSGLGPVDVQLVIAADVSLSMDADEKRLQARGFAEAFRDPRLTDAIARGPTGRIAVAYFEWGGARQQRLVVPWTIIDGTGSAADFAERIGSRTPGRHHQGTSIAGALNYALGLMEAGGLLATRRVINISGDGVDDRVMDLDRVRGEIVRRGIVINGMAVVYKGRLQGVVDGVEDTMTPGDILQYFEENVIGGEGAFVEPVKERGDYSTAIMRKLIREIRGPSISAGLSAP